MPHTTRLGVYSVTYALQGRDILSSYGITATVVRLRPNEAREGCAFGLEVARKDAAQAVSLLKKAEIDANPVTR